LLFSAVTFVRSGKYANLSCDDPANISTGAFGRSFFHSVAGAIPTIFTSVILVDSCFLDEPKVGGNTKPIKVIQGALLSGEWERYVGAIGMVTGEAEFRAQLYKDFLSFSTTAASGMDASPSSEYTFNALLSILTHIQ
jgi:hypothetical protein